jgi:hypothetical protein
MVMTVRHFPPPWAIDDTGACFVAVDLSPVDAVADSGGVSSQREKKSP